MSMGISCAAMGIYCTRSLTMKPRARRNVPSPLVGEGQGGGDSRTSDGGVPPTPNPSPPGGGESARSLWTLALHALQASGFRRVDDADVRGNDAPALREPHPGLYLPADLARQRLAMKQRGGHGRVAAVGGDHRARARAHQV